MKLRKFLLPSLFFVSSMTSFAMWGGGHLGGSWFSAKYGAESSSELSRVVDAREFAGGGNADHSLDADDGFRDSDSLDRESLGGFDSDLNATLASVKDMSSKWDGHLKDATKIQDQEKISSLVNEAEADRTYLENELDKTRLLLEQNNLSENPEMQSALKKLEEASNEVINKIKEIADVYLKNSQAGKETLSDSETASEAQSPLYQDHKVQVDGVTGDRVDEVLVADSLAAVVKNWPSDVGIKFHAIAQKYTSDGAQPKDFLKKIQRYVTRTAEEREQARDAIKMIARDQGTDYAKRFENDLSVRWFYFCGAPLTPGQIQSIKKSMNVEDARHAQDQKIYKLGFESLRNGLIERWTHRRPKNGYEQVL